MSSPGGRLACASMYQLTRQVAYQAANALARRTDGHNSAHKRSATSPMLAAIRSRRRPRAAKGPAAAEDHHAADRRPLEGAHMSLL